MPQEFRKLRGHFLAQRGRAQNLHLFAQAQDFARAGLDGFDWDRAAHPAALVTEPAANTFPALPVREGENVFVPVVVFAGAPPAFDWQTSRTPSRIEILRLVPTARSHLHA